MLSNASLNFMDPANPLINLSTRNLSGNAGSVSEFKFIITELSTSPIATKTFKAPNSGVNMAPYVNLNSSSLITFKGDSLSNTNDPTTSRYNTTIADGVTLAYDTSVYTTGSNTGFKITINTAQYDNTDIVINLANLYTFTNFYKYSVEAVAVSTSGSTFTWDVGTYASLNSTNLALAADTPVNRYITAGNTDDIILPTNGSTESDFGFNNITNNTGTLLVGIQLAAGSFANNTTYDFILTDNSSNQVPLPDGSRILLYDYTPTTTNDVIDTVTFNDSNFTGGLGMNPTNQFSFANISTAQSLILGVMLPVVSGSDLYNSIVAGDTLTGTMRTASSGLPLTSTSATVMTCLYEDTEVLTPSGYVSVKQLKEGDEVTTSDGRTSQILKLSISKFGASYKTSPLIIKANSIAENYPPKDCRISKYHMIQYNGGWIAPYKNEHIFKADESIRSIKYYHIQLENFKTDHLVINGGLVVESLCDSDLSNANEWDSRCNNSIIL